LSRQERFAEPEVVSGTLSSKAICADSGSVSPRPYGLKLAQRALDVDKYPALKSSNPKRHPVFESQVSLGEAAKPPSSGLASVGPSR
jgi:hypothetical protein